jgi:hypothetical protein
MASEKKEIVSEILSITWKWIVWLTMLLIMTTYVISMALEYIFKGINYLLKAIIQSKTHDK